jgi:hypothetical protein
MVKKVQKEDNTEDDEDDIDRKVDDDEEDQDQPPEGQDSPKKTQKLEVALEVDSDDDFQPISIKDKVLDFLKANGPNARIPSDLINEAVRWRLN